MKYEYFSFRQAAVDRCEELRDCGFFAVWYQVWDKTSTVFIVKYL
jgi:hypothetical protein